MTQYIEFKGKALYCKPWPAQIDRDFEDPTNPRDRGGNWSTGLIVNDDQLKLFNAIGSKAKAKRIEDLKKTDGLEDYIENKYLTFRRYEKLGNGTPITEKVRIEGVEEGTVIGNGSDITVTVEVYHTEFKSKPVVGIRWVAVKVDNLVEYTKPETPVVQSNDLPPVH